MSNKVKSVLLDAKNHDKSDEETLRLLVRELQYFGGRTLANTIRHNGIKYAEIADDVAKKLKIKCPKSTTVEEKEVLNINCNLDSLKRYKLLGYV